MPNRRPSAASVVRRFAEFLQVERRLEPRTIEGQLREVRRYLEFLKSQGSGWDRVTAPGVFAYIGSRRGAVSNRTVARIISSIRGFHRFLAYDGLRKDNPAEAMQAPRVGRRLPHVLTVEEVESLLAAVRYPGPEGPLYQAVFHLLYDCGLRISEALGLRLSDLHLADGTIKVKGKGDRERIVPIGESAIERIERYMRKARRELVEGTETDLLFVNREGRAMDRHRVWCRLKRTARKAGIEGATLHGLRHAYATHLLQGGADLRSVQELLGHRDINTTLLYAQMSREDLRRTHERFHPLGSPTPEAVRNSLPRRQEEPARAENVRSKATVQTVKRSNPKHERIVSDAGSLPETMMSGSIGAYLRFIDGAHGLSPALRKGYREDLGRFGVFCASEGVEPLAASSLVCRQFIHESERVGNLAPRRIERLKVNVEAFYRWAERTGRTAGNPMTAIRQEERRLHLVGTLPRIEAQRQEEHYPALVWGR